MTVQIDRKRLIFPGLAGLYERLAPFSYAFMRFCTGAILVPHGYLKFFAGGVNQTGAYARLGLYPPAAWSYLVAFVEFFCAIMLALGLFTRFAAAAIAIEMGVIVIFFNGPNGYLWTKQGYEYPLLWLLLCIGIFFRGGGRYSLDHLIGKEL